MRLISSTQPTSTRRWPSSGSSPVVSVSRTISRILLVWVAGCLGAAESLATLAHFSDRLQDVAHLRAGMIEGLRTVHDKVGAGALVRIRHLLGEKRGKFLCRHARPLEGAAALDLGRRRHYDHGVAAFGPAGLEQ